MSDPILTAPKFPNITTQNYSKTSERTPVYNCVAHAVGDYTQWWWPHENAYWPPGCPLADSIDSFDMMFSYLQYAVCEDGEFEQGFDKIALYALNGVPTHAARQVSQGRWSSKIGQYIDIEHAPDALEGPRYGYVIKYYRKPVSSEATPFSI